MMRATKPNARSSTSVAARVLPLARSNNTNYTEIENPSNWVYKLKNVDKTTMDTVVGKCQKKVVGKDKKKCVIKVPEGEFTVSDIATSADAADAWLAFGDTVEQKDRKYIVVQGKNKPSDGTDKHRTLIKVPFGNVITGKQLSKVKIIGMSFLVGSEVGATTQGCLDKINTGGDGKAESFDFSVFNEDSECGAVQDPNTDTETEEFMLDTHTMVLNKTGSKGKQQLKKDLRRRPLSTPPRRRRLRAPARARDGSRSSRSRTAWRAAGRSGSRSRTSWRAAGRSGSESSSKTGSSPFPTMEELKNGQSEPFLQDGGQYIRAFEYRKGSKCVLDWEKPQVSWSDWTAKEQDGSYNFKLNPGTDNVNNFASYKVGDLLGIKWKYSWNNPFRILGATDLWFKRVKWLQNARGVIRATEKTYATSDIRFIDTTIASPKNRYIAAQCMTSTGGGPQIGQEVDNYDIKGVKIKTFEARSVGDDAIGLFGVKNAKLRGIDIRNAFRAGILLSSSTLNDTYLKEIKLQRAPFYCEAGTATSVCKKLNEKWLEQGANPYGKSTAGAGGGGGSRDRWGSQRIGRLRYRSIAATADQAVSAGATTSAPSCRIKGLSCAVFYAVLAAVGVIVLAVTLALVRWFFRRQRQGQVPSTKIERDPTSL